MSHTKHLNTNKQFMRGNFVLAFLVIATVVIFIYMSMQLKMKQNAHPKYTAQYSIILDKSLQGDSIQILLSNSQAMQDSVLVARGIVQVGDTIGFQKFESNPSLQVIEYPSENFTPFDLGDNGGIFRLVRTEVGLELEAE